MVVAVLILVTPVHANTFGTLVIASNTTLTEDHEGNIVIEADNVTLDCAGHTISGPGDNGIFFQFRTGVTVKNCRVTGFTFGILVDDSTNFALMDNVAFGNGAHAFDIERSSQGVLRGNTARENGGIGFAVESASIGNRLTENLATNNGEGFWVRFGSDANILSQNIATGEWSGVRRRSVDR